MDNNTNSKEKLEKLRRKLDSIDADIIDNLVGRFQIVDAIAKLKKEMGLPVLDSDRWQEVLDSKISLGQKKGLDAEFVREMYEAIHKAALKREHNILN